VKHNHAEKHCHLRQIIPQSASDYRIT
jgi:hypothetical protein